MSDRHWGVSDRDAQVEAQMIQLHSMQGKHWFDSDDAEQMKRLVGELTKCMSQKSGGAQGVAGDIPFTALPRILGMLGCLCIDLVGSGALDAIIDGGSR